MRKLDYREMAEQIVETIDDNQSRFYGDPDRDEGFKSDAFDGYRMQLLVIAFNRVERETLERAARIAEGPGGKPFKWWSVPRIEGSGVAAEAIRAAIQDKNNTPLNSGDRDGRQDSGGEASAVASGPDAGGATGTPAQAVVADSVPGSADSVRRVGGSDDDPRKDAGRGPSAVTSKVCAECGGEAGKGYGLCGPEGCQNVRG